MVQANVVAGAEGVQPLPEKGVVVGAENVERVMEEEELAVVEGQREAEFPLGSQQVAWD